MSAIKPGPVFTVMELRDQFAMAAIDPVTIVFLDYELPKGVSAPEHIAQKCYEIADAMLAERSKK